MCLVVKPGENIRIAYEDIKVYKVGEKEMIGEVSYLLSPFMRFEYEFDKKYSLGKHLKIVSEKGLQIIEEGFHTYISRNVEQLSSFLDFECVAIIPKGAEYCFGLCEEVVSNELIVLNPTKIEWEE